MEYGVVSEKDYEGLSIHLMQKPIRWFLQFVWKLFN